MAETFKDYYKILGVDRKATEKAIKAAYRQAARQHHPDVQAKHKKASGEEKFKEVNEAYAVLGDPEKRAEYDHLLAYRESGQGAQFARGPGVYGNRAGTEADLEGFSDFFKSIFGEQGGSTFHSRSRQSRHEQGQDLESELELTLEEAYRGGQKNIQFTLTGSNATVRTLDVKIPAFIRDGNKIRLKGQGGEGQGGGQKGDLILTIRLLQHKRFVLNGNNIETSVKIRPEQAVLGCQINVPTLDGEVTLTVPPMFHNGRKLRLKSKGWPGNDGKRGDELVKVMIDIPDCLSPDEQKIYQQLADLGKKTP